MNDKRRNNNKLQDSGSSDEMTALPSSTSEGCGGGGGGSGCASSIESSTGGGWFGGIGSDIRTLAYTIKDNIPPAIGDIAAYVQDSALSMAAEISKLESEEAEDQLNHHIVDSNGYYCGGAGSRREREMIPHLRLPWEILLQDQGQEQNSCSINDDNRENNNDYIVDDDNDSNNNNVNNIDGNDNHNEQNFVENEFLKEKIFDIGYSEDNFFQPYLLGKEDQSHHDQQEQQEEQQNHEEQQTEQEEFVLDEPRIILIRRLLEIDQNLASVHARLSGRSDVREILFWKNYFHHCSKTRKEVLQTQRNEKEQQQQQTEQQCEEEVMEKKMESPPKTPDRCKHPKHNNGNNNPIQGSEPLASLDDDSSYVNIATPPTSMNSWAGVTMKNNIDFSIHSMDEKNKPAPSN